jgi:putative ABC transport system permease protein
MAAVMIIAASRAAVQRSSRSFPGATWFAFGTLVVVGLVTTLTVTTLVIGVEPWYQPRYLVPLLGMVLGNSLTGISLCLDSLLESLADRRAEVEMELSHGASRWEAARTPLREAVRRGLIPIINSMMVVGIVSLPGMMTGQILAGADPLVAVKYQIVIMFMIAAATSLGAIGMALLVYRRLFNERHQLRADLIARRAS